jgi:hypothetical protein
MTGAAKAMPGIRLATKVVIVGILILPFALFFFNVIRFAVDIPVQDDYGIFVGFILGWLKAGGLIERLGLIFVQQNEHRVAFARLVTLAEYSLTGKVNFSVLTVFGTIGWGLSVALLCYVLAKKYSLSIVEVLPIPYILFMFTQFNNMFMATTAITFYSSILFSLLLFLSLVKKKTILACLLFIIALFTNGNGVLLFPVGVLYLLLERRWREAGTYGASCLVFTLLFFLNYQRPEGLSFAAALRNLETLVSFPFAFLGNIVPSVDIALILGTVVVLALVYFVIFRTREHFLFLTAIWLLGTAALVALTRNSLGLEEAVSSRYAQYSLLAVILVYAWLLIAVRANRSKAFSPSRVTALAFVVSAALFFGSVYKYESIGFFTKIEQDKIAGMATFASSGDNSRLTIPDQFKDGVQKALVEARQLGFYDFKCLLEVRYPVLSVAHVEPLGDYLGNVEEFDGSHISGWAVIPNLNSAKSVIFILLQNQDRTLELQPIRVKRTDVSYVYNNGLYTFSGYEAYLAAYSVPVGIYTIGILVVNGDNQALHQTGQEFSAP